MQQRLLFVQKSSLAHALPSSIAPLTNESSGPFGCIGKQLALMEIRTVACLLIDQFDVRFAPNENGFSLLEKSTDTFTMRMGDLNLLFEERVRV